MRAHPQDARRDLGERGALEFGELGPQDGMGDKLHRQIDDRGDPKGEKECPGNGPAGVLHFAARDERDLHADKREESSAW